MDKLNVDINDVKKLVELVETHHLDELKVEEGDLVITIKGKAPAKPVDMHPQHQSAPVYSTETIIEQQVEEPEEIVEDTVDENIYEIAASLVGVFYRAPSPDASNFVEIGDVIEVGSEVGLIEAMKVFSPIPSEVAGEIIDIPAENGKLVQQGDVLVRVKLAD